jgi:hypothetical protein
MLHATLIGLHGGAGVVAFACGLLALARPRWLAPYQAALVVSIAGAARPPSRRGGRRLGHGGNAGDAVAQ